MLVVIDDLDPLAIKTNKISHHTRSQFLRQIDLHKKREDLNHIHQAYRALVANIS